MSTDQTSSQGRIEFGRVASPLEQFVMFLVLAGIVYVATPTALNARFSSEAVITLSVIGLWRWSWGGLQYLRAIIYRYWHFPRLRRQARRAVQQRGPIREVTILATTYCELPWITKQVVRSLVREFRSVEDLRRAPTLVFVTGCDEDDDTVREEFAAAVADQPTGGNWPPELVLLRGDQGKRLAIAKGLHYLEERGVGEDSVIALMDGDSALEPGVLTKSLPLFRLSDNIAGMTTNERPLIEAPAWFAEWIGLRFGQRHLYMCSFALSHSLLCLTGRFSLYRADIATNPGFIEQIEHDRIDHWLFGEYNLLTGDDKSTWFWVARNSYEMLYVPDAMVITYEVIDESAVKRAIANLFRWSGNTLRNSWRTIRLGPGRLAPFTWWATVDQRISMWTALIGPIAVVWCLLVGRYDFIACYLLWILLTRTLRVASAWRQARRISVFYIPMQLFSEWTIAFLKVWLNFHPVKQKWAHRGNQRLDPTAQTGFRRVRRGLAMYYWAFSVLVFIGLVGTYVEALPVWRDLPLAVSRPATAEVKEDRLNIKSEFETAHPVFWGAE
jgi:glycosyltransferase Alg8